MAGTLSDAVFDAALNYVKANCNVVQLVTSASTVLVAVGSIASTDYTGPANGSTGRKLSALTSSAVASQAVSSAGSISKLRLLATSTVHVVADVTSAPIAVGSSDTVTIGSFKIELADPA